MNRMSTSRITIPIWEFREASEGDPARLLELASRSVGFKAFGGEQVVWLPVDPSPQPTTWMIDFYEVAHERGFIGWDADRRIHLEFKPRTEYTQEVMHDALQAWRKLQNEI